jgi:N6-L-threonylcarbamoyladenine synthase
LNTLQASDDTEQTKADIAYAFQEAVADTFVIKCRRALQQTQLNRLVVAGGVSANRRLREKLNRLMHDVRAEVFYPRHEFCTDNGAMIAFAGYLRLRSGQQEALVINAKARWGLHELAPL